MDEGIEKREFTRIEDFIAMAKEGKQVQLSVTLRKEFVTQKVQPEKGEEAGAGKEMYLLIADYAFRGDGRESTISKIYVSGTVGEPVNATKQNTYIANARLKMDYMRLREVNIPFDEVFWQEWT